MYCEPWNNNKAFQINANCLLADSTGYILNKFEHVRGEGDLCSEVQVEQLLTCPAGSLYNEVQVEHVLGGGEGACARALYREGG